MSNLPRDVRVARIAEQFARAYWKRHADYYKRSMRGKSALEVLSLVTTCEAYWREINAVDCAFELIHGQYASNRYIEEGDVTLFCEEFTVCMTALVFQWLEQKPE